MSGLAEDDIDESPARLWLRRFGMAMLLLAVGLSVWFVLKGLVSGKSAPPKKVTKISILPDTPPPPPPPPPKEPPKEQPREQPKEIKMEPPKTPEAQPPAEALKMEGAAGDGPSPFAAGTVTNDYKGGEVAGKTTIGGSRSASYFAFYTSQIKTQIEDALAKDKTLSSGKYVVVVHLWLSGDGRLKRFELAGSSGAADTDDRIKAALAEMPPMRESPPEDMPQPVKLRITARNAS